MSRTISITMLFLGWAIPFNLATAQERSDTKHEVIEVQVPEVPDRGPYPDVKKVGPSIVEKTNAFRMAQVRKPVSANAKLTETAQAFADFMAEEDKYGHTADGKQPAERAKKQGYDYCIVLENIAYAFDSSGFDVEKLATQFENGWENSPGHRRNMLDPDITETGVAVARSEKTGHYYAVQLFGRPKSEAIDFALENKTKETIEYTLGDQSFSLQPRYTRRHTICRPEELKIQWPDKKSPATTLKPAAKDRFTITKDGSGFQVKK